MRATMDAVSLDRSSFTASETSREACISNLACRATTAYVLASERVIEKNTWSGTMILSLMCCSCVPALLKRYGWWYDHLHGLRFVY